MNGSGEEAEDVGGGGTAVLCTYPVIWCRASEVGVLCRGFFLFFFLSQFQQMTAASPLSTDGKTTGHQHCLFLGPEGILTRF